MTDQFDFDELFDKLTELQEMCFSRPEQVAAENGQPEAGTPEELNHQGVYGTTALHLASISPLPHAPKAIQALLAAGADPDLRAADGAAPLLWAVRWGAVDSVLAFDHDRLDSGLTDASGRNAAIWWAMGPAGSGSEIDEFLADREIDFALHDSGGWCAIHWAAAVGGRLNSLLQRFPEMARLEDRAGLPPIFHAAAGGVPSAVEPLLAAGADPGHRAGRFAPVDIAAAPDAFLAAVGGSGEAARELSGP